ncbi:GGDEF domain-containing protein [Guptibacillus hwajinpoensis]|uniref:Diguanylate cyclase n=1 Tax=Guptibacillus hwajinpoensis TaxID=208199 RepID=A0ABU0K534_9BACL|nr:diguanylate cyclase [Alkalihalobacillus hemicentroti]MDQ0484475.1 diguanylate cyclase [Alkalihalobacillus hemicentroti]
MQLLQDFFINMMIVLALIFIYFQVFRDDDLKFPSSIKRKVFSGLYAGMISIFLMIFSIKVNDATIVDLRHIPLLVVTLYGGTLPGLIALVVIQTARFIIGVNVSSFFSFGLMTSLYLGYLVLRKWNAKILTKAFWMLIYSNVVFSILIVYFLLKLSGLSNQINFLFWITSMITGLMAIYTTEHLRKMNQLFSQYKRSATIDPLTGLNNVRSFDEALNNAIHDSKSNDQPLSLLVIDIDFFKNVNDTYGHSAGDAVLQQFGLVLREAAGHEDIVSRNGGEEFTLLLLNSPHDTALEKGERLRSIIENHTFKVNPEENIHITASIGVATYPETIVSPDKFYSKADQALYTAKRKGRNQICSNNVLKVHEYAK